jgi:Na+-driven multidrug efflux pump
MMHSINSIFVLLVAAVSLIVTVTLILLSKNKVKKGQAQIADTINRVMIVFAALTFLALLLWLGVQELP